MANPEKLSSSAPTGAPTHIANDEVGSSVKRRSESARAAAVARQQRDQLFDEAAQGMQPAHPKKQPVDPLQTWWPQIRRKLKEGFSVRQIHEMTCAPEVGLKVSLRALQRFIAEHKEAAANRPKGS